MGEALASSLSTKGSAAGSGSPLPFLPCCLPSFCKKQKHVLFALCIPKCALAFTGSHFTGEEAEAQSCDLSQDAASKEGLAIAPGQRGGSEPQGAAWAWWTLSTWPLPAAAWTGCLAGELPSVQAPSLLAPSPASPGARLKAEEIHQEQLGRGWREGACANSSPDTLKGEPSGRASGEILLVLCSALSKGTRQGGRPHGRALPPLGSPREGKPSGAARPGGPRVQGRAGHAPSFCA